MLPQMSYEHLYNVMVISTRNDNNINLLVSIFSVRFRFSYFTQIEIQTPAISKSWVSTSSAMIKTITNNFHYWGWTPAISKLRVSND